MSNSDSPDLGINVGLPWLTVTDSRSAALAARLGKAVVLAVTAPFILGAAVAVATAGAAAPAPPGGCAASAALARTTPAPGVADGQRNAPRLTCVTAGTPGVATAGTVTVPAWYSVPPGVPGPVQAAIGYALGQLGKPYLWGGTGPAGYDCSGLVMMAYRAAGITIPRTTFQQVDVGAAVSSFSDLLPGDLLFKAGSDGTPAHPGHVGMYIGGGLVVQAPHTGTDLNLTPAAQWRASTVAIQRIVNWTSPG